MTAYGVVLQDLVKLRARPEFAFAMQIGLHGFFEEKDVVLYLARHALGAMVDVVAQFLEGYFQC